MSNEKKWWVYIAQTASMRYYVGITTDPQKRVNAHNTGKGSRMAQMQGPFTLVYTSQPFAAKSEARKREVQLKKWTRQKKENLISGRWS